MRSIASLFCLMLVCALAHGQQPPPEPSKPPAQSLLDLVLELVFGPGKQTQKYVSTLHKASPPAGATISVLRYWPTDCTMSALNAPPGASAVLLDPDSRLAVFLVDGQLTRQSLSDSGKLEGPAVLVGPKDSRWRTLIGFAAGDVPSVVAVGLDRVVARVELGTGQVHRTSIGLEAEQLRLIDEQSIASDGRVAILDSPHDGVSNLLLRSGLEEAAERVKVAGAKLVPRWTRDGRSVVFLSDQVVATSTPLKLECKRR